MSVITYEAIVENGQVRLPLGVVLPEKATVYVVVPAVASEEGPSVVHLLEPRLTKQPPPRIQSPRLTHPEQAVDFVKEVYPEDDDA
jgi:hypothetical protein